MTKKSYSTLGASMAALLISTAGHAVEFTPAQTQSFSLPGLNESQEVFFDGFDDSLGDLLSVHVSYTAEAVLINELFNTTGAVATVGVPGLVSAIWDVTVTGPLGVAATDQLMTPGYTGPVDPSPPPQEVGRITGLFNSGEEVLNGDPTSLADYIGGVAAVTLEVAGEGNQGGSVPPGVFSGNSGNAAGSVSLFYDYEPAAPGPDPGPVPAPGVLALMGLGLAGLAAVRRKRAKR